MKRLVIEKQAIKKNIALLKKRAEGAAIYAVLTGDSCGVGLLPMAKLLRDEGIVRYGVNEVADAAALRHAGLVEEEILMLRATTDEGELEELIDLNVVCTVASMETALALNAVAERRSTVVEAHVQIDSGMGFGGFLTDEGDKILGVYRNLPNVALGGIYTQIHAAGAGEKKVLQQVERFTQAVKAVEDAGFAPGIVHAAGSYALLRYDCLRLDAVRVGSALLGRCKRVKTAPLVKVGYGEASIDDIHWLPKGHTVGNEGPVKLRKPTRVAVLPVGYQNGFGVERRQKLGLWGWLRHLPTRRPRWVRLGGQKARIIGTVGAMETILDVTDLRCSPGDVAQFEVNPQYANGLSREWR